MRFGDQFVRAPMPGATHIRIVKRRVDHRTTSSKLSRWVGDAMFGSEGPSADQPVAPSITTLEWASSDGRTLPVPVPADTLDNDDIGAVLAYARRYGIGVSVWSESAALDRAMSLEQSWFPVQPLEQHHPEVNVTWGRPGCVDVSMSRSSGSFDQVLGKIRRRQVADERWSASLDDERLIIGYQPPTGDRWARTWRRADVIAIGNNVLPGSGTVMFAVDGAVAIPSFTQRGPAGDAAHRMQTAVRALNAVIQPSPDRNR